MRIDYEISEQDFLNAQRLAIKNSPVRSTRWTRLALPAFGLISLAYILHAIWSQGFSLREMPAFIVPVMLLSLPLLNRRAQKRLYARSTAMHGNLSLEATEEGLNFKGTTFDSKVNWSNFNSVFEDSLSFVLLQSNNVIFNIIPKSYLTAEQVKDLGELLRRNINNRSS